MRFSHCFMRLNKHRRAHTRTYRQKARTHTHTLMHFMICTNRTKRVRARGGKTQRERERERERETQRHLFARLPRQAYKTNIAACFLFAHTAYTYHGPYISYLRFASAQQHQHTDTLPSTQTHCSHVHMHITQLGLDSSCGTVLNPWSAGRI